MENKKDQNKMNTIHLMKGGENVIGVQPMNLTHKIIKDNKMDYSKKSEKELVELLNERDSSIEDLTKKLESSKNRTSKRKQEVLELLKRHPISIYDMSIELDITNKNVSSQLCYLKKDEYLICTNSSGEKFLEDYDYSLTNESDSTDEDDKVVEDQVE